jgi:hypothetical protein
MGPGDAPDGQPAGVTRAFPPVKIKDAAPEIPHNLGDVRGVVVLEIMIENRRWRCNVNQHQSKMPRVTPSAAGV